ncbi:MAG TPA: LemA family protein [Candidatus Nitrosotenuis sp.]|jgi:LemA protein
MVSKFVIGIIAAVAIIAIIIVALYGMYFSGFNAVQGKDENVKRLAADVDAQLQRRYDLIPNLVESVKGYMQFEKQTLEDITKLRSQWQTSTSTEGRVELSNQIEQALSKIILTYEAYPDLKSDQTVTRLMDEIAGTENRIAVARTYYNDGVRDFNTNIRTFPNNIFNESGFLGMSPWGVNQYPTYEATTQAQTTVPQVDLTQSG